MKKLIAILANVVLTVTFQSTAGLPRRSEGCGHSRNSCHVCNARSR